MSIVPLNVLEQLVASEKYEEAIPLIEEFLRDDQRSLPALRLMARSLDAVGRTRESVLAWQMSILVDPEPYESLVSLSEVLWKAGQKQESMDVLSMALQSDPDRFDAHLVHSGFLCDSERFEDSLIAADLALACAPGQAQALYARARALRHLGRHREAEFEYSKVVEQLPSWPRPRFKRAIQMFIRGEFKDGVADYEQRWLIDEAPARIMLSCADWQGESFNGGLLIYGEQGIGDEIFFMGFYPLLNSLSGPAFLAVDRRLVPLFARSFPKNIVLPRDVIGSSWSFVQRSLPAASLLALLVRHGVDLPCLISPYLRAASGQGLIRAAEPASGSTRSLRIGICWRSDHPVVGHQKSIDLSCLDFLADLPGSELISLQHGDISADIESFAVRTKRAILRPDFDIFNEIDLLAALISSCDCIVVIPGIAAHLAGALGVHAIVISRSPRGRVWYWEGQDDQSNWYDSIRVFRGSGGSDLSGLLARARTQLLAWLYPS